MTNGITTKLEKLNLLDRFLFDETMENKEVYQATVSILLEREITLLDKPETEKEFRISPQLREIRVDVVSADVEHRLFYSEMQQRNTGNLRKRSRYYQGQLDVSLLEPGSTDFNALNDSCFILIAPFDIFGRGLFRYTFEGACKECPDLKIEDGAVRIFINTKGTNIQDFSQEFLDFMSYINDSSDETAMRTTSSKIKMIHENVTKIRASEKMGVRFMQLWEEKVYLREEARAEGIKEGRTQERIEGISIFIRDNHEEGKSKDMIISKLMKHYAVSEVDAENYVRNVLGEECESLLTNPA